MNHEYEEANDYNYNQKKQVRKYQIKIKSPEFQTKDGVKHYWNPLGILTVFSSEPLPELEFSIDLNHIPGQKIRAFPFVKKDQFQM